MDSDSDGDSDIKMSPSVGDKVVGSKLGRIDGSKLGTTDGIVDGSCDRTTLGPELGISDG